MERTEADRGVAAFSGAPPRHPIVYTILIVPFGVVSGFVSVTLAFIATKRGLTVQQGADLIAIGYVPQIWKFFWAPVADTTLSRRPWYLISSVFCAVGIFFSAAVDLSPATFGLMELITFLTSLASTVLGFSVEGTIASLTPESDRGRVSGWYQAGNLGGTGIGGGLGLWLLNELPAGWETGLIMAVLMLACAAPLPLLPNVPATPRVHSLVGEIRNIAVEIWHMLRSRVGALSALLCIIPIGTGAALGVLAQAEVAAHWGAGPGQVELVQGFLSGIISMFGCVAGGYACNRLGSRIGYAIFGGLMAAVTAFMALLPASSWVYVSGSLAYSFVNGLCYAAFSAFVLDAIGTNLPATKYNGFASLSNTPIWYMGLLLAAVETGFGPKNMLFAESACGVVGIIVFVTVASVWRPPAVPAAVPA